MAEEREPVDLIVGDFNAVSRSIGFDALSRGRRVSAGLAVDAGLEGHMASFFPVFDIDHVWVHSGWTILGCRLFTNFGTDHRGQWVRLGRPPVVASRMKRTVLLGTTLCTIEVRTRRFPPRPGRPR